MVRRTTPAAPRRRKTNPREFYETPPGFTRFLDRNLNIYGRIYCPTVGDGVIVRALQERPEIPRSFVTNDVDLDRPADFHFDATDDSAWWFDMPLGPDMGRRPDWVVENPPFSAALPILKHALTTVNVGVALHLRISFPEPTLERESFLVEHPPDGMFYLPRYSFDVSPKTGKRATDSTCTAWCIWLTDDAWAEEDIEQPFPFQSDQRILVARRAVAEETFNDRRAEGEGAGLHSEAEAGESGARSE